MNAPARNILPDLNQISKEQLLDMIAALQAQAKATPKSFSAKVSEKGCLSIQCAGLRRFGASYYASEWRAILDHAKDIEAALAAHATELARKV